MIDQQNVFPRLVNPEWEHPITSKIVQLEKVRSILYLLLETKGAKTPHYVLYSLREIFDWLESLSSARIEGNQTTTDVLIQKISDGNIHESDDALKELKNIKETIKFVESDSDSGSKITLGFLLELHKILVKDLPHCPGHEGSSRPGKLRESNPSIANSKHKPIDYAQVASCMEKFLEFINSETREQNQLLVTAISHHYFAWLHPFDNGNGRMARLLTYSQLLRYKFRTLKMGAANPAFAFVVDRNKYYDNLSKADSMTDRGLMEWCDYFISGIADEIEKFKKLLDKKYTVEKILLPSIRRALDLKFINDDEFKILSHCFWSKDMLLKSANLNSALGEKKSLQRSRIITKLLERKLLVKKDKERIYRVNLSLESSPLVRSITSVLEDEGFIPPLLNK